MLPERQGKGERGRRKDGERRRRGRGRAGEKEREGGERSKRKRINALLNDYSTYSHEGSYAIFLEKGDFKT